MLNEVKHLEQSHETLRSAQSDKLIVPDARAG